MKITTPFFNDYLNKQSDLLNKIDQKDLLLASNMISKIGKNKLILVGNGGSASICSHMATDFAKVHNIRSLSFSSDSFLTCFANDYGYENWVARAIDFYADEGDVLILISSSGSSENMLNAADAARNNKMSSIITLSGFDSNNPLRSKGDINLCVQSTPLLFRFMAVKSA